jgi:hypothetical protein
MKKKLTPIERFNALSDAEKAAEVAPFEGENLGAGLAGKPLTSAQRKQWLRIRKKARRGRPILGQGAKVVPVSIERGLLKKADTFARTHKIKRSQMVAEGLRLVMQRAKAG